MLDKFMIRIPEQYKSKFNNEIQKANTKNIIILGLLMLAAQIVSYLFRLYIPFTNKDSIMASYYLFSRITFVVDLAFMCVLIYCVKKIGYDKIITKVMTVLYLILIHKWAMATAVVDQFQGEGVAVYFFSMFFIVIMIDLSIGQVALLFGAAFISFILLLNGYADQIGDTSETVQATGQFIGFSLLIAYYIRELRKKNFLQNESLSKMNSELEFLSYYDPLSGLYNRRRWELEYYLMYKEAVEEGKLIGLIILDIDYFKQYNDAYGHVQGDNIIKSISSLLVEAMDGQNANIGRYGGDEFAISLYNRDNDEILQLVKKIKEFVKLKNIENKNSLSSDRLTLSIGWRNIIPESGDKEWDLVSYADRDLYLQKNYRRLKHVN